MNNNLLADISNKHQEYLDLCHYYNISIDPIYVNIDKYITDDKDATFKLKLIINKINLIRNDINKKREIVENVLSHLFDLCESKRKTINHNSKSFIYITELCVLYSPNFSVRNCLIKISEKYNVNHTGLISTIKSALKKSHSVIPSIIPNYSSKNVSLSNFVNAMYLYINEKLRCLL